MSLDDWLRRRITRVFAGEGELRLVNKEFDPASHFQQVEGLGLYLHIPFCRQICPYCPYNKVLYHADLASRYTEAVLREIDRIAPLVGDRKITSFYIGGGTPTTLLQGDLAKMLDRIYRTFNMKCGIHLESHPNDLSQEGLEEIAELGVEHLSIGVEALQDRHLRTLQRPYTAEAAKAAIYRVVKQGFDCVNVDQIFALPDQTRGEVQEAVRWLIDAGVDQITTYPLFSFPYTRWPMLSQEHNYRRYSLAQKRDFLRGVEEILYPAGYARTSVWAFTRVGKPKYCSVTVPAYFGLGASAATYLRDIFYLNTFNVQEYIQALSSGKSPAALNLMLTRQMQMAGWLYWRVYETHINKGDFQERFGQEFDPVYGKQAQWLARFGLLQADGEEIRLTDSGSYWLHALQDFFSLDYVSKLWGTSQEDPWPRQVLL